MLKIKKQIAEKIIEKVKQINPDATFETSELAGMLEYPPDANMGDLAFPCFKLSKTLRMAPVKIAEALAVANNNEPCHNASSLHKYGNIIAQIPVAVKKKQRCTQSDALCFSP